MSQSTTVLGMLRSAGSNGVKNYEFQNNRILCYTKRISELRRGGFNILTENVKLPNGRSTGVNKFILIEDKKKWWKRGS